MSYKVTLPVFEGPFDLLVYLIENAKMSIYDIRISEITEQYIAYIERMKAMDFAVASEFMVLAATLIDIKTKMILPRNLEAGEIDMIEDPRSELVERLIEYKKYKELSEKLAERAEEQALIFDKPQEDISTYLNNPDEYLTLTLPQFVTAFELFLQKEKKMADVRAHYQRVEREKATIESRIAYIGNRLKNAIAQGIKKLSMRELILNKKDRYDVIVTFVSVLQMMKDRLLDADQPRTYGDIFIKQFRAAPIPDGPEAEIPDEEEPRPAAPSKYVKIADEEEAKARVIQRTRTRKDADMSIVERAREISKASASVTAIIDEWEKEKAQEEARAQEQEQEGAPEQAEAPEQEQVISEENADGSHEEN